MTLVKRLERDDESFERESSRALCLESLRRLGFVVTKRIALDEHVSVKLALRRGRPGPVHEREGLAESDAIVAVAADGRRQGELEDEELEFEREYRSHVNVLSRALRVYERAASERLEGERRRRGLRVLHAAQLA